MTPLSVAEIQALKKDGIVQQRQKGYFILRIRLVAGDAQAQVLESSAKVSRKFGRGEVHFTTRQSLEIPWIPEEQLLKAKKALTDGGCLMGACGPRVRGVVGCPGSQICRFGQIDTKALAARLDADHFGRDLPHKFKFGVTGCVHNCAKATENDVGLMGVVEPSWDLKACNDCKLCVGFCPTKAISRSEDGTYRVDPALCLGCPQCVTSCPRKAWTPARSGVALWIGGTMGRQPRMATRVPGIFSEAQVPALVDRALAFFEAHGQKKERFGRTLDRVGLEAAVKTITGQ